MSPLERPRRRAVGEENRLARALVDVMHAPCAERHPFVGERIRDPIHAVGCGARLSGVGHGFVAVGPDGGRLDPQALMMTPVRTATIAAIGRVLMGDINLPAW